jgi:hypothetical protein
MALRDKMKKAVAPHLEPDEAVQEIFGAQTKSQYFILISYWILLANKAWRVVAVTDRRIIVFQCGRSGMTKIGGITAQTRRHTRIGPPKGLWYRVENLGERLYVHKRFHKDIAAADAWATDARGANQPS